MMSKRLLAIALMIGLSVVFTSCGDSSENYETVFIYFINAYPGTAKMTVIGPTGPVSEDLAYGERTAAPIEIDRSRGVEYQFTFDSRIYEGELPLFAMYPHETATLMVSFRADEETLAYSFYRHVQSIDDSCILTFDNNLSVTNDGLSKGLEYTMVPEFRRPTSFNSQLWWGNGRDYSLNVIGRSAYAALITDEATLVTFKYKECPIGVNNGQRTEDNPDLLVRKVPCCAGSSCTPTPVDQVIDADPWFYPYVDENDFLQDGYGLRCLKSDGTTGTASPGEGGTIFIYPTSQEYVDCVVDILEPFNEDLVEEEGVCPAGGLRWDDFDLGEQFRNKLVTCLAAKKEVAAGVIPPGGERFSILGTCGGEFRIRTPGLTSIFGPEYGENAVPGFHQNGDYINTKFVTPPGSEHFYVPFGRPVNPLIWQWNSGEAFVDLAQYPYFNGQDARVVASDTNGLPQCVSDDDCRRLVGDGSSCVTQQLPFVRNECTVP